MTRVPTSRLVDADDAYWQVDELSALPPFLIHVVSADDHWVFLSSAGGITAGRRKAQRSLFPYETDDRLHHAAGVTGGVTWIRTGDGRLWHPLDARGVQDGHVRRLRKAVHGDWVELEEEAPDLGLVFTARYTTSPRYGLVRQCRLARTSGRGPVQIIDGLLNLLPAEVPLTAQQTLSALVDAYKRSEHDGQTSLARYVMESRLSDRAAPSEALRANVVWRSGLPGAAVSLTETALAAFREGRTIDTGPRRLGERGAYLVHATVDPGAAPVEWSLVAEVHLDHSQIVALEQELRDPAALAASLDADLQAGRDALIGLVAAADGQQHSGDPRVAVSHFANVVYNIMRGGVFAQDHDVPSADFARFVRQRNRTVYTRHRAWLVERADALPYGDLHSQVSEVGDPQLERLALEYLPLTFSRRHGDPSRPWNAFDIVLTYEDGTPCYDYQGNWRDIFQNWEALARSFPAFYPSIVAKFVNASTMDGFNAYRITREGIDWEVPDPEDPWSNIGYWGDHQVVYLFRLVEAAEAHEPGCIKEWLGRDLFSYADVPYRIRPYADLVADAKDTIEFDEAGNTESGVRVQSLGSDGRLVVADGQVKLVNLVEKLLVSLLAKMSNLVIDGGIWLNTQRPEWNDANNALVGQGLSIVTLAQLRHAFTVLGELIEEEHPRKFLVSNEVVHWLEGVVGALTLEDPPAEPKPIDDGLRRHILDKLGAAFSEYRTGVYERGLGERHPISGSRVMELCRASRGWIDHTLRTNRREDGLFHSYNSLVWTPDGVRVERLSEMLEGQVAVLGSGLLTGSEAADLVDALYASALYRADQHTFVLYPNKERPDFLDRNRVDAGTVEATPLLAALVGDAIGARILLQDAQGVWHWQADLDNASALGEVLDQIAQDPAWASQVQAGRAAVLEAYETTFDHQSFTGRSGTMHKYEGLGSVYWHMVGKLLVSVQEAWQQAVDAGEAPDVRERLANAYLKVRAGLPFNKSVAEYGAIPTDPYSHTPFHLGAQQPGMTGQVKETFLARYGELGVRVRDGSLEVAPGLLGREELSKAESSWTVTLFHGEVRTLTLPAGTLGFTLAQVPFVLSVGTAPRVTVTYSDGNTTSIEGRSLGRDATRALFERRGLVSRVDVVLPESDLRAAGEEA